MENGEFVNHAFEMAGGCVAVFAVVIVLLLAFGKEEGKKLVKTLLGAMVFLIGPLGIAFMLFLLFFMPR